MKRTDPQMRIRLPADVKRWVEMAAIKNMRTQNAEIVMAVKERMAKTGVEFGDTAPADAGNNSNQEKADVRTDI